MVPLALESRMRVEYPPHPRGASVPNVAPASLLADPPSGVFRRGAATREGRGICGMEALGGAGAQPLRLQIENTASNQREKCREPLEHFRAPLRPSTTRLRKQRGRARSAQSKAHSSNSIRLRESDTLSAAPPLMATWEPSVWGKGGTLWTLPTRHPVSLSCSSPTSSARPS